MNKKDNIFLKNAVLDGITIVVVIFVMASIGIFGYRIFDELNTDILNDEDFTLTEAQQSSTELHSKYPSLIDNLVLFAFVLLIIFTLVSVFLLDTHPIFFIITVMLLVGVFLVSIILANTYDDIMQDDEFADYANEFPYITWLMTHLLELAITTGFMLGIALFIKFRVG